MIFLDKITFEYKKGKKIIDNYSYVFSDTGFYSLIGESGSGKTTLLNIIGGIYKVNSGKVLYSSNIIESDLLISYVFQDNNLFGDISVIDNIRLIVGITSKNIDDNAIDDVLDKLKILKYKKNKVSELSGGERQRVSIAIALLKGSKVILADEPCASLDDDNAIEIMQILKELSNDKLVIIASHNKKMVYDFCDHVINVPLDNSEEVGNSFEDLLEMKNTGKGLSIAQSLKTHRKVFGHKLSLNILSIVLCSIFIALAIFSIAISNYSKRNIMERKIQHDNITDVFVTDTDNVLPNEIKEESFVVYDANYNVDRFNYVDKENSSYYSYYPIKKIIVDESLENNEIEITDFVLYNLRYFEIISFKNIEEMIGKNIIIRSRYGENVNLKIKKIIPVKPSEFVLNDTQYDNCTSQELSTDGIYQYAKMNKKMLFILEEYSKNGNIVFLDKVDDIPGTIITDSSLKNNEVILSSNMISALESKHGKKFSEGDIVEFSLSDNRNNRINKVFIIKQIIVEDDFSLFYYSADIIDFDLLFEFTKITDNTIEYYFNTRLFNINKLIDYAFSNQDSLSIYFEGSHIINNLFQDIDFFKKISIRFVLIISIIVVCFMFYTVASKFKINKKHYKILQLYGMKKSSSLLFMIYDNIPFLIISCVIGSVLSISFCSMFDQMLKSGLPIEIVKSYNIIYNLEICFISLFIQIVIISIYYVILSLDKKKSYIGF